MNKNTIILIGLIILGLFLVGNGCEQVVTGGKISGISPGIQTSQELKKFSSVEEIRDYLDKSARERGYYGGYFGGIRGVAMGIAEEAVSAEVPLAKTAVAEQGAADYSQTNIQVEGVDEADFVKNDDKYIYILSQDKLVIVDAYPAEDAKILSKTEVDGNPMNLFVNRDRLVIFSVLNDETYVIPEYNYIPMPRYSPATHAYVYDISDRKDPELIKDFSINGNYFDSRMIDDYIYFISQDAVYYYNNIIELPVVRAQGERLFVPEVYYFDNPEQDFVFHTVASFNIEEADEINANTFMMGYSNTLYVSRDNIYISYQKNLPYTYYKEHNEKRFYEAIVPLLPSGIRDEINEIKSDDDLNSYERWQKISSLLENMYNNMDKDEKEKLVEKINEAVEEYETKLEIERRKTVIHKIAIDRGEIDYKAKGEVLGYLLNQFSLDEFDDNLRVATTIELWTTRGSKQYNNVFVLDEDMEVIGKLEEIAQDERIYSTRFIGDRLYMVTFKRIDPLFVIDLSDPEDPEILGELKIPGYSDYLHPYDEDHIIGIGKETSDNEWGGISIKGVKVALFDVSDVNKPKVIDSYEIGEAGTDSEALQEHKAFLFDKEKNILVIPIREVKGEQKYDPQYGYYRQKVWQGAYVFGLTPEDGIELKGRVSHSELDEDYGWYYGSPYAVRRSLYMDNVLYTVSSKRIVMNSLDDVDEEINEIDLPYKQDIYYPKPLPIRETVITEPGIAEPGGIETVVTEPGILR